MHIVIFTHPDFIGSKSMPKYANLLFQGMKHRGHTVQIFSAEAVFFNLPFPVNSKKWLGYIDQYIIFPLKLMIKTRKMPKETLFVFSDQALGPWVPFVAKRPHIIHCHDFLAQRSALGEMAENKVGITGKIYQAFIRNGYRKGKNFISISLKTQNDLHCFLKNVPRISEVVYNGFNQDFQTGCLKDARQQLENEFKLNLKRGFILHVGGNQFYKNRKGVIAIYCAWRKITAAPLPLIMIGSAPSQELLELKVNSEFATNIHFLINVSDEIVQVAYRAATVLLYPSLEEGFGWPIAEAMACGCPVITTGKAPMNEVGGESCFYIPHILEKGESPQCWQKQCALVVERVCRLTAPERQELIIAGLANAQRFDTEKSLEKIEVIYKDVLITTLV